MRAPGRYRDLTAGEPEPRQEESPTSASRRREDLKAVASLPERPADAMHPTPGPAPRPSGMLDPDRAMHAAQIQALNDIARSGRIDWAEWGRRVRDVYQEPRAAAKNDELAEARAAAAEARAREQAETAQQRTAQRER